MADEPAFRPGLGLPPDELERLTDILVQDPTSILRIVGLHAEPGDPSPSDADLRIWVRILDDARDLERRNAPGIWSIVRSLGSTAIAVAGLGLALAAPITTPIAMIGLGVGAGSGIFAFWDGGNTMRNDLRSTSRIEAIDLAKEHLLQALA